MNMELRLNLVTYLQCYTLFLVKNSVLVESCDKKWDDFVIRNIGLSEGHIWSGHAQQVSDCIRMCVRRKPCLSMNYDFASRHCELNSGTLDNTPTKTGHYLVYSSFDWWPASIDAACYDRPCNDDEVCVPGRSGLAEECSYFCMSAGRKVCPMPPGGVSNGRYVNDVNVATCPTGFVGSDSATCLETLQWSKELNPQCLEIYNSYPCTNETLCSTINAVCTNGKCLCEPGQVYDNTLFRCVQFLRLTPPVPLPSDYVAIDGMTVGYLEVFGDGVWNNVCYDNWYWKATEVACRVLLGTEFSGTFHAEWYNIATPQPAGNSKIFKNIQCTGSELGVELCTYDALESCNHDNDMVLSCFIEDLASVSNVVELVGGDQMSGNVMITLTSVPRPLCSDGWGNKATSAVCRTINPSWSRDSHNKFEDTSLQSIAKSVACVGDEPHIFYCRNKGWGHVGGCPTDDFIYVVCDN